MAAPGPKPRPALQVVREGNPGKRPVPDGVVLLPEDLVTPDWDVVFGDEDDETRRARQTASELWNRLAPVLRVSTGLVRSQQEALEDYCVTWARIQQGERAISRAGMILRGDHGNSVRNPWSTVLNQYRSHLRSLIGELGLSPSAATRLSRPESAGDDDPFD